MLGNRLWSITYNAPAGGPDAPAAIAVIEAGGIDTSLAEIYVTGRSFSTFIDTSTKYLTMKYTETH
jgi:hypothetical protein